MHARLLNKVKYPTFMQRFAVFCVKLINSQSLILHAETHKQLSYM